MPSNFDDVAAFHEKFEIPRSKVPAMLTIGARQFRTKFMQEELDEFVQACEQNNLELAADALVDLVYVALGTADMMGLPWQRLWAEVQRANMSKERAKPDGSNSKRGSALDVIKPPGWTPPDHKPLLGLAARTPLMFCCTCGSFGYRQSDLAIDRCTNCDGTDQDNAP